ncbi:MAG: nuclear transport factor 2 family protein [Thermodesulfobacteriota bacterium]
MEEVIRRYFECVNREDFDGLMALWAEDGEFTVPLSGTMRGKGEIRKFYESVPVWYPKHNDDPVDVIMGKDKATIKIVATMTTPQGKKVQFTAVDWMVFEAGKIKTNTVFFDSVKLLKDLKG